MFNSNLWNFKRSFFRMYPLSRTRSVSIITGFIITHPTHNSSYQKCLSEFFYFLWMLTVILMLFNSSTLGNKKIPLNISWWSKLCVGWVIGLSNYRNANWKIDTNFFKFQFEFFLHKTCISLPMATRLYSMWV